MKPTSQFEIRIFHNRSVTLCSIKYLNFCVKYSHQASTILKYSYTWRNTVFNSAHDRLLVQELHESLEPRNDETLLLYFISEKNFVKSIKKSHFHTRPNPCCNAHENGQSKPRARDLGNLISLL